MKLKETKENMNIWSKVKKVLKKKAIGFDLIDKNK